MRIEKVLKKDEKNVTLILDNNEKLFLSYEVYLKSGLRKNEEISDSRFSILIEENQLFHIRQKAFRLLGRRQHSAFELKLKLKQKRYNEQLIDRVINQLRNSNYLNDLEFAKTFTEENIKNKLWGQRKIEAELIKKGIDREIITQIINEKFSDSDQFDNAIELARKKYKSLLDRNTNKEKIKSKLISFLLSRGYNYDTVKKVAETIIEKNNSI
jgi:regulatory protein